jgi:hypothetical protein
MTDFFHFYSKRLSKDRGGYNLLLGQSYRTPHGAVIDEYGAMV